VLQRQQQKEAKIIIEDKYSQNHKTLVGFCRMDSRDWNNPDSIRFGGLMTFSEETIILANGKDESIS
jgi:hypothetical protein